MEKREKQVNVFFFITGQNNKSHTNPTPNIFNELWINHYSKGKGSQQREKAISGKTVLRKKTLVLNILEESKGVYFGYIGVFRDSVLPTVYNTQTNDDKPIPLTKDDEVLEKSYFIYNSKRDLLSFHKNHLGPTAGDLSYMLFELSSLQLMCFEPIWKDPDLKALLDKGTILKSAEITIALPRKLDNTLELKNKWCNEVMNMMSDTGMSRLTLRFFGRASTKKGFVGYLTDDVKQGFKEFLDCGGSLITKAKVRPTSGGTESLLDQELKSMMTVEVIDGYPTELEMKRALENATNECKAVLDKY